MTVACCSRFVTNCLVAVGFLDQEEPDLSEEELNKRIQLAQNMWDEKDGRNYWSEIIPRINPLARSCLLHCHLSQRLENFKESEGKTAVDLGCGVTSSLFLLQQGWTVYAVDSSQQVLGKLARKVEQFDGWTKSSAKGEGKDLGALSMSDRLTCVCSKMEEYQFPEGIQVVLAKDSLPYCEPNKVEGVMRKAYEALVPGGYIIGNFFPKPLYTKIEIAQRKATGISGLSH